MKNKLKQSFKATLKQDIQYRVNGQTVTLRKSEEIEVETIVTPCVHFSLEGKSGTEQSGSFIGYKNGHRFDLEQAEFKTVD